MDCGEQGGEVGGALRHDDAPHRGVHALEVGQPVRHRSTHPNPGQITQTDRGLFPTRLGNGEALEGHQPRKSPAGESSLDRGGHVAEGQRVRPELSRLDIDRDFLELASHRSDFGHPRDGGQHRPNQLVLKAPQLDRVLGVRRIDQDVLEDRPGCGGERTHLDPGGRWQLRPDLRDALEDGPTGEGQVGPRGEDDVDVGQVGHRAAADGGRAGKPFQGTGQRPGHPGRHLGRGMARPVDDQGDLRVREIRKHVTGKGSPGQLASDRQAQSQGGDEPVAARAPRHHAGDHRLTGRRLRSLDRAALRRRGRRRSAPPPVRRGEDPPGRRTGRTRFAPAGWDGG